MEVFYGRDILLLAPVLMLCVLQALWLFIPAGKMERTISPKVLNAVLCLCLAITVGTLLRQYPWTTLPTQTDSSVFLYIGKQMHAGKVPYVDLFDHKGPIQYFIQYLGYSIWPNSIAGGVWILEVLSFGLLSLLMLRVSSLVSDDVRNGYLGAMLVLIVCAFKLYQGGNYTDEHALLWIMLAAYIFFSFFRTGKYTNVQLLLLGASCMVVLLLQENLVTVWVAFIPVVFIRLIHEKRTKEIWRCMLLFIAGMLIVLIPVLIWAAYNHCLKEMWDCYVLFNFVYSKEKGGTLLDYWILTRKNLTRMWPGVFALVISLIRYRKDPLQWLNLWFFIVSVFLMQLSGRDSLYYMLLILPCYVIPAASFFDMLQRLYLHGKPAGKNPILILLSFLLLITAAVGHRELSSRRERYNDGVVEYLQETTEKSEDILIFGNYAWPYLAADRTTENRFFFQWPPVKVRLELYQEFLQNLLVDHPSDLVILPEHENSILMIPGKGLIDDTLALLEQHGYVKEQHDGFSAWIAPWKQQADKAE